MGGKHTSPVRGMRDLLPAECALRDQAADVILRTYRAHGFQRIETPALEHLELLGSSQGGENEKLIYKILKRGEKLDLSRPGLTEDELVDAGLRFDLSVPLARYYAEHQAELPVPFKAIQVGPVWRAERPQKGRYRQFTQMDIDIIGDESPAAEVQLLLATTEALAAVGLSGFTVRLNDRRLLHRLVQSFHFPSGSFERICIAIDKQDKVGWEGVVDELSAAGLPEQACKDLISALRAWKEGNTPVSGATGAEGFGTLDSEVSQGLDTIRHAVSAALGTTHAFELSMDPTLVRGMGYYTGPIFEIAVDGMPYSLAGGGRYDRLIGGIVGRDVPATGFSIGFERLISLLEERGWSPADAPRRIALVYAEDGNLADALGEASQRRSDGAIVSVFARRRKAGKQRADLERQGFDEIVEFGADGGHGTE
jgi:histidyl-tRNA synthetase